MDVCVENNFNIEAEKDYAHINEHKFEFIKKDCCPIKTKNDEFLNINLSLLDSINEKTTSQNNDDSNQSFYIAEYL